MHMGKLRGAVPHSWWRSKGLFIATQLNSTELNSTSSWVELCRYKRALKDIKNMFLSAIKNMKNAF